MNKMRRYWWWKLQRRLLWQLFMLLARLHASYVLVTPISFKKAQPSEFKDTGSFHSLTGLTRLHILVKEHIMRRQVTNTLLYGQVFVRFHLQIHSRRIRMVEHNQGCQRYLEWKLNPMLVMQNS